MIKVYPEVKKEITGWRDLALNDEHRKWGWNCPAVDLDHLFLEYDKGIPVAVMEYKRETAPLQYLTDPTYRAIIELTKRGCIPFFVVRYAKDFSWWKVRQANEFAEKILPEIKIFTRKEWIQWMHQLRGYALPDSAFDVDGNLV